MTPTAAELHERIEKLIPRAEWTPWPGGYPDSIERGLLDSVFSMQATYSRNADRGPLGVANRWADERGGANPDDLTHLANAEPSKVREVLANAGMGNRGRASKAELAQSAARNLVDLGVTTSREFRANSMRIREMQSAWTSVPGLGKVTFEYFAMLLGEPGVKADVMIRRFVGAGDESAVSAAQARKIVKDVADRMDVNSIDLDHAIWAYQRANS